MRLFYGKSTEMLAIPKVFDIGSRLSVQARKRPRSCTTTITQRDTIATSESTNAHTIL
jgi:hypothetical protein